MKRTAIIMAGGSGERFWPMSRRKKPKQLLSLETDKTMLEQSIDRIAQLIPVDDIYIITSALLLKPIRDSLPMLPPENVIAEPFKRNTAPCLALGAAYIASKYKNKFKMDEISVAVLTADQSIKPVEGFVKTISTALDYVENNNAIATIGIVPSRPDTGYGYIEAGKTFAGDKESGIQEIVRFHEKPDIIQAQEYLNRGNFLWNSGMFFWRLDVFEQQLKMHLPSVGEKIQEMIDHSTGKTGIAYDSIYEPVKDIFETFPDISIDFGLMEKAENAVVAKALFQWDDIGSWDSLDRILLKDENGNILNGSTSLHDVKNSTVINTSSNGNIIVAGIGIEDFVVVVTDDAVLVCPKNRVQDVKKCVQKIKNENGDKWL